MTLQHVVDWKTGESYFAVVRGTEIIKVLHECRNWKEARIAYRAMVQS